MIPATILIPAAGASSRMRGGDKLLEPVDGLPCLRAMADRALAVTPDVIVTLPRADHPRAATLDGLDVVRVIVPDALLGMSRSLVAGAAAVPSGHALMVLPADMPGLQVEDIATIAARSDGQSIIRGADQAGRAGHPILFPPALVPDFASLTGDRGAAPLLSRAHVLLVPLSGDRATLDLDTPEDWAAFRART